jgi:alpha-D-ribose 1-methylphosphonate 5-triphosphate synthase subunit PhnH
MSAADARSDALSGGFADPVFDAQATFRAVLDALARPGRVVPLAPRVVPPAPLSPAAAAVLATLADDGTPVFLDETLDRDAIRAWIGFNTGAPVTGDPAAAAFAAIGDPRRMPALAAFSQGTAEYPDRSTTIVLQVTGFDGPAKLRLIGPGIDGAAVTAPHPLPAGFVAAMTENRAQFPRGVDLVLAAPGAVVGLPRSVRITEAG